MFSKLLGILPAVVAFNLLPDGTMHHCHWSEVTSVCENTQDVYDFALQLLQKLELTGLEEVVQEWVFKQNRKCFTPEDEVSCAAVVTDGLPEEVVAALRVSMDLAEVPETQTTVDQYVVEEILS